MNPGTNILGLQKVHLGFSLRAYGKTWMNFLANPIYMFVCVYVYIYFFYSQSLELLQQAFKNTG